MPCPHNEISIVQRSHRQSAVAAAAYQSGEKLFCVCGAGGADLPPPPQLRRRDCGLCCWRAFDGSAGILLESVHHLPDLHECDADGGHYGHVSGNQSVRAGVVAGAFDL